MFVHLLDLIFFATCEGRQKPYKYNVTKSHKIIADSPFIVWVSTGKKLIVILKPFCNYIAQYITVAYRPIMFNA